MHLFYRRVELFNMADQQNNIVVFCRFYQPVALFFRGGQRFFHHTMNFAG